MRYVYLLVLLSIATIACKKKPTVWESDWGAPVINDTLDLVNLVNDTTLAENGGFYVVDLERTILNRSVSDFIEIPDTTVNGSHPFPFLSLNVGPGGTLYIETLEYDLTVDDLQLQEILLESGMMDLTLSNPTGLKILFNVKLPGVSKDGQVFNETYSIEAGSIANPTSITERIDLQGYHFDLTGESGYLRNTFVCEIRVISDASNEVTNVTNNHVFKSVLQMQNMKVNYALGYFGNRLITDTINERIEAMDIVESGLIDVPESTIELDVYNGIKASAQTTITTVKNENNAANVVELTNTIIGDPFLINPATGAWSTLTPSKKEIVFSPSNSNVEAFVENLGAKNEIGYAIELNPWGNVSTNEIYPNSRLKIDLRASMPLAIGADNLKVRDTFAFNYEQDPSKTHITKGEFLLKTSNAFPLSAAITFDLLDETGNVLHTVVGTEEIKAAQAGSLNSDLGLMVADSDVKFVLPESVLEDISRVKSIVVTGLFNSTNITTNLNEQMDIPVGAFLSVKLRTRFTTENRF